MRLAFLAGRPSKTVAVPCSQGGNTEVGAGAGGKLHEAAEDAVDTATWLTAGAAGRS